MSHPLPAPLQHCLACQARLARPGPAELGPAMTCALRLGPARPGQHRPSTVRNSLVRPCHSPSSTRPGPKQESHDGVAQPWPMALTVRRGAALPCHARQPCWAAGRQWAVSPRDWLHQP